MPSGAGTGQRSADVGRGEPRSGLAPIVAGMDGRPGQAYRHDLPMLGLAVLDVDGHITTPTRLGTSVLHRSVGWRRRRCRCWLQRRASMEEAHARSRCPGVRRCGPCRVQADLQTSGAKCATSAQDLSHIYPEASMHSGATRKGEQGSAQRKREHREAHMAWGQGELRGKGCMRRHRYALCGVCEQFDVWCMCVHAARRGMGRWTRRGVG